MNFFLRTLLFFSAILFLSTCKKGEDDPAISLRTRKARLTGAWRMVSGTASETYNGVNVKHNFDGIGFTANVTPANYPVIYIGDYRLNLEILKDGTFNFKEVYLLKTFKCSGVWNFNTGVGEEKKKESVIFSVNKVDQGFTTEHLFNRYSANFTYKIRELRNKKIVINSSGKIFSSVNGDYATFSSEFVFVQ